MPLDPRTSLAALADALAAVPARTLEDLFIEQVREVWWRRGEDGHPARYALHREGAAARRGGTLASSDGVDRLALSSLLGLPARTLPPVALPEPPPPPELPVWSAADVAAVRWRWSWAAVLARGRLVEVERPVLAEVTSPGGARDLSVWPPGTPAGEPPSRGREVRPPRMASPVLLAPAAASALIHELVGHRLEADVGAAEHAAPPMGTRLFAFPLDVADDPTLTLPGGFSADDEGVPAAPRMLLSAGVVTGTLADRRAAARLGLAPGNARRGGVHAPPRPRLSNLMTRAPGSALPALRAEAHIEVGSVEAAAFEATVGVVWLAVRHAWLLRRGHREARLAPFTLRGTLAGLGAGIIGASTTAEVSASPGWCRKHGEVVATGGCTPWLLVDGLEAP